MRMKLLFAGFFKLLVAGWRQPLPRRLLRMFLLVATGNHIGDRAINGGYFASHCAGDWVIVANVYLLAGYFLRSSIIRRISHLRSTDF